MSGLIINKFKKWLRHSLEDDIQCFAADAQNSRMKASNSEKYADADAGDSRRLVSLKYPAQLESCFQLETLHWGLGTEDSW